MYRVPHLTTSWAERDLQRAWEKSYQEHRKKMEEERLSVIDRDNCLLLQRVASAMKTRRQTDGQNDLTQSLNRKTREQALMNAQKQNKVIRERNRSTEPWNGAERWREGSAAMARRPCKGRHLEKRS
ncbi:uncharacterized protein CFAP97D2 isoform X3 [Meriones unguiculatus]|uniref:uncharacterized protein CFAP97D2 isoform X3 n=1 Tax=Meriones unguiculatus TaxID=10047 RepID=UPI00293E70CC|nr:uncharacterized protein CFAP97D2 isoform X3 [Meriones unguiculatus]